MRASSSFAPHLRALASFAFAASAFTMHASPAAASRAGSGDNETVSIRVRPNYGICAGVCPWFEARVEPSGRVTVRQFVLGATGTADREAVRRILQFWASAERVTSFRERLGSLRPARNRRADATCPPILQNDRTPDPLDMSRNDDIQIIWRDRRQTTRLTACLTNQPVRDIVHRGLRALGLYITGDRIEPGDEGD